MSTKTCDKCGGIMVLREDKAPGGKIVRWYNCINCGKCKFI